MSKKSYPLHEPLPYYMSAMGMAGARFIEGATEPVATPVVEPVVTPEPVVEPEPKDEPLGEGGKKALDAERSARKIAEDKVAAYEKEKADAAKASLSDIERANAEAAERAQEATDAKTELARYKVAAKYKITDADDLELLATAPDEAAMERLAVRLAKDATPGTPKPDPSGGARNEKPGTLAERLAAAEKAGDKSAVAVLKAQQLGSVGK